MLLIFFAFLSVVFSEPEKDKIDKQDEIVDPLNRIRAKYCLPPVIYDKTLADLADITAKLCLFTGSDPSVREEDYRSLLIANDQPLEFPLSTGETVAATFAQVATTNVWENQFDNWNCSTDTCLPGKLCDSLRQILWLDTVKVGCARYLCDFNSPFPEGVVPWSLLVCNYYLPGIYQGQSPFPFQYCRNCSAFVPTAAPTARPTKAPTPPTLPPTARPTAAPTRRPTAEPTRAPTPPTRSPTNAPTLPPPTEAPTPYIPQQPVQEELDEDKDVLKPINEFRAKWCLPPLEYSKSLAMVADYFAQRCMFNRSDAEERNMVYRAVLNFNQKTVPDVIDTAENLAASVEQLASTHPWEVQADNYNCAANTCANGTKCDSYLNMVALTATKVGCARYLCDNRSPFPGGQNPWRLLICEFHGAYVAGTRPFPPNYCSNCSATVPTAQPTSNSKAPTRAPTRAPTDAPTPIPVPTLPPPPTTAFPTFPPTPPPPTTAPTPQPTPQPTPAFPTFSPTTQPPPTNTPSPTRQPTTAAPTTTRAPTPPTTPRPTPPTASEAPTEALPTDAPTTEAPVERRFANVTWTYKIDRRHTPSEVATFIRQAIRTTTRFFLRSNDGVETNFKRASLAPETWTASIYATEANTNIYAERDRLANFLKSVPDQVDAASVSSADGFAKAPAPEGLSDLALAGIIIGAVFGFILLVLLLIGLYLFCTRKSTGKKDKEYDLL